MVIPVGETGQTQKLIKVTKTRHGTSEEAMEFVIFLAYRSL